MSQEIAPEEGRLTAVRYQGQVVLTTAGTHPSQGVPLLLDDVPLLSLELLEAHQGQEYAPPAALLRETLGIIPGYTD